MYTPVISIQDYFTRIVDNQNKQDKSVMINEVIDLHFMGEKSSVQTSSYYGASPHAFLVRRYLNSLVRISKLYSGQRMNILVAFLPKMNVKKVVKTRLSDGKEAHQILLESWQLYIRYNLNRPIEIKPSEYLKPEDIRKQEGVAYVDLTKKDFLVTFFKDAKGLWKYRVDHVIAHPAITAKEFEELTKLKLFFGTDR